MDLFDIARMLWRRAYVVLPIGAVTLAVALLVQVNTPPEYEAVGFLQLQTPELDRAEDPTSAAIDPVALSQGIALEGDASFSVSPLDGQYFTITVADQDQQDAEAAVSRVIADLAAQITALQDDAGIPAAERVDVRMADPQVSIEVQEDNTVLATVRMFLYNAAATFAENPYRPDASTGRLLQVAAMGDVGQRRFDELAGEDVEFIIGQDSRDAAALLEVLTTGPNAEAVVDAFYDVQTLMAEDLAARQARADVADSRRITIEVLDAPLDATDVSPPVSRAVVGIIGLGGLLALGTAVGVESLEKMQSGRERQEPDDREHAPVDDDHSDGAAPGDGAPTADHGAAGWVNGHPVEPGSTEPAREATAAGPPPGPPESEPPGPPESEPPGPPESEQQPMDLVEINEAFAATTRDRDDE